MADKNRMTLAKVRRLVNDFPDDYNAHHDGLTDAWEHRQSVNDLLKALRFMLEREKSRA